MKHYILRVPSFILLKVTTSICVLILPLNLQAADGRAIYDANCKSCHGAGVGGAPALNDKQEWKNRLEKGIDGLVEIAIKGVQGYGGSMPPRGGNLELTDLEIRAAVVYMIEQIK